MRVVFFGTPTISANVLSYLLENDVDVVAIVSKPDKSKGRSSQLVPTPVKLICNEQNSPIPIFLPEKVSAPEFSQVLTPFAPDLFVVVAYGEILKQHILDIPKIGCINLHMSLLPKYRGAAPIQRSIIAGERETGITIMHMVRKMDAGDIIRTAKIPVGLNDTFGQIEKQLGEKGAIELLQTIRDFEQGNIVEYPQDESQVTYAPKIELEDCQIDWNLPAEIIHNLIRGVNPYPGAWCRVLSRASIKTLKIWTTKVLKDYQGNPGQIHLCDQQGLIVSCFKDALLITELQLEGKRAMHPAELFRGNPIQFLTESSKV